METQKFFLIDRSPASTMSASPRESFLELSNVTNDMTHLEKGKPQVICYLYLFCRSRIQLRCPGQTCARRIPLLSSKDKRPRGQLSLPPIGLPLSWSHREDILCPCFSTTCIWGGRKIPGTIRKAYRGETLPRIPKN